MALISKTQVFKSLLTPILCLIFGTFFLGLFQVAILPPFEGFDETAHYSYTQQVAFTGSWPQHGDPMSADIDQYLKVAPTATSMHPTWTYRGFFGASDGIIAAGRKMIHTSPPSVAAWHPGAIPNWEAQHPPLYYVVLAPAFRLAASWSLGTRLLLLRGLSYTLSWLGLALAAYAAWISGKERSESVFPFILAPVLWPLIVPMWFPAMARLGNDSLVTLLAGCLALLVVRALEQRSSISTYLALGLCLGAGLLTKATFLPVTAATVIVLTIKMVGDLRITKVGLLNLLACLGTTLIVAGWWYVRQLTQTGNLIGSNDAINLAQTTGLWEGLQQHASPWIFLRMLGSFGFSLVAWRGTWSFVAPPFLVVLPVLLCFSVLAMTGLYFALHRRSRLSDALAPLTLALFFIGLVYHSIILIAAMGAFAPAWYLHSFTAVLWPLLAWGVAGAMRWRISTFILVGQLIYSLFYLVFVAASELVFYSGCGVPSGNLQYLTFSEIGSCLSHPLMDFERLAVISFPWLALSFFIPGIGLLIAGVVSVVKILLSTRPTEGHLAGAELALTNHETLSLTKPQEGASQHP